MQSAVWSQENLIHLFLCTNYAYERDEQAPPEHQTPFKAQRTKQTMYYGALSSRLTQHNQ